LMCSGRLDPQFVLAAFAAGADGVLIGGCHPGDCHYVEGNYKALRRVRLLEQMIPDLGIEPARLRLEWIAASEGDKVQKTIDDLVAKVRVLGPLGLPERFADWDREAAALAEVVEAAESKVPGGEVSHVC
jgi:F420-non-reducing hydrogenase iron-sulfur subunit